MLLLVKAFCALHQRLVSESDLPAKLDKAGIREWDRLRLALVQQGVNVEVLLYKQRIGARHLMTHDRLREILAMNDRRRPSRRNPGAP